jgi:guanylate kinase
MIVLITGPSGAGKSSFIHKLMDELPRLAFSVSTTTRPIREGEVDGRDYDYVDASVFDSLVDEDAFVEWAKVHDNCYGTRKSRLQSMIQAGQIPVLDIDVQGGVNVIDMYGSDLVSVFLFPPSWEELERRLVSRETDTPDVIATRLHNARTEVGFAPRYKYWIVNDELDAAVARMKAVITAEECRPGSFTNPPLSGVY